MTSDAPLILIVEDEPQLRDVVRASLHNNGYRCIESGRAQSAIVEAENRLPDVIIADLGLPDRDGIELIKNIRRWSQVPIIVLSARSQESDKVLALDAGADDYVTKPFNTAELLARLRVALRHAAARGPTQEETFSYKNLFVDLVHRHVTVRDVDIHLTPIEFRLLSTLITKAGQVVTHAELLRRTWGPGKLDQHHYLRIYMANLRRKLEDDPAQPIYLLTEVGVGYRLACS